jgi:hypothetical protein
MQARSLIAAVLPSALLIWFVIVAATPSASQTLAAIGTSRLGSASDPDPVGCRAPDPKLEARFLEHRVVAPRKEAWQNAHGGQAAARIHVQARLAGWPSKLLIDPATLAGDDAAFLRDLARDTWRGLAAMVDREHGLPIDHVRYCGGSLDAMRVKIGDYTSGSDVGLFFLSVVGAVDLDLLPRAEAIALLRRSFDSLRLLESHAGFFFNYYDTTSLERTSHFVSFVDSAWLTAGLIVVRQAFPELWSDATQLIDRQDYGFFYDADANLMLHGFDVEGGSATPAPFHYGTLYTEARLGALIAIAKGDAPESLWWEMQRTQPATHFWQRQRPQGRREKVVHGHRVRGGSYVWNGLRYVPSWGGSMFEALMPVLALDERSWAPRSLGRNDAVHAEVQRRHALETLGYPIWGMSPSTQPFAVDYGEFGVPILGTAGYRAGVVTPHASALALAVTPVEATANLRRISERYDAYGEYGLYDAIDPETGAVAYAYLSLDQSMSFVALANHLGNGAIQRRFAADPAVAPVLPMLKEEDFFE